MKHRLRRRPRPRLKGHKKPHYDEAVADILVDIASHGGAALRHTDPQRQADAMRAMTAAFRQCVWVVNPALLEVIWQYVARTDGFIKGEGSLDAAKDAERALFAACREALGITD